MPGACCCRRTKPILGTNFGTQMKTSDAAGCFAPVSRRDGGAEEPHISLPSFPVALSAGEMVVAACEVTANGN